MPSCPLPVFRSFHDLACTIDAQVSLGIATILYFVPTDIAATHQGWSALKSAFSDIVAGSLTLLTMAMWFVQELKRIAK